MRNVFISVLAGISWAATVAGASNAQQAPAPAPATAGQPSSAPSQGAAIDVNYLLGPSDVIEVSIVGRPEYNVRARVGNDGLVALPLIGSLAANNVKPAELADKVRKALETGGFYSQPIVRVEVITVASRFITVLGNVGQPGLLPLERDYRLSEVLAKVGARALTDTDYVVVTRPDGKQARYIMKEVATGGLQDDPFITSGDKIYVPAVEKEVFYIMGAVRAPGSYSLDAGMTIRTALAKGGGVNEMGNEKKVEVYRGGKKLPKADLDTRVEVGDIIKFGERMF